MAMIINNMHQRLVSGGCVFHIRPVTLPRNGFAVLALLTLCLDATVRAQDAPPSGVSLAATSHAAAIGQWSFGQSNDRTVEVSWTPATDDVGVAGYRVVWDTADGTAPDASATLVTGTTTTSPDLPDGTSHFCHVRAEDTAGQLSAGTLHVGPFYIDTTPPGPVDTDLLIVSHPASSWEQEISNQNVVQAWLILADDNLDGAGIQGYVVRWDNSAAYEILGLDDGDFQWEGFFGSDATSPELPDGTDHYLHVCSVDNAGNFCPTTVHYGPIFIDTVPPTDVTGLATTSHPNALGHWSDPESRSNDVDLNWATAIDLGSGSGVMGYDVYWERYGGGVYQDYTEATAITIPATDRPEDMPDGIYTIYVQAVDEAGNVSAVPGFLPNRAFIDTAPPVLAVRDQTATSPDAGVSVSSLSRPSAYDAQDPAPAIRVRADGGAWLDIRGERGLRNLTYC